MPEVTNEARFPVLEAVMAELHVANAGGFDSSLMSSKGGFDSAL